VVIHCKEIPVAAVAVAHGVLAVVVVIVPVAATAIVVGIMALAAAVVATTTMVLL
jgi:hypothetical protein